MSTPPPRSPLFPYTTLFRSARDRAAGGVRVDERRLQLQVGAETVRRGADQVLLRQARRQEVGAREAGAVGLRVDRCQRDRKSTRLNSSHLGISYAVFCLKKK